MKFTLPRAATLIGTAILLVSTLGCAPTEPGTSPDSAGDHTPPASSASPSKVTSLRATDWRNAIIDLPTWASCVEKRLQFADARAMGRHPQYGGLTYKMLPYNREPIYSDLTGDGTAEAVVVISCTGSEPASRAGNEYFPAVVVYTENAKGGPQLLGAVPAANPQTAGPRYRIQNGRLLVDQNLINSGGTAFEPYRWNGTTFTKG